MRGILLLLLCASGVLADVPKDGSLCFIGSDEPCRVVRRERLVIALQDHPRTFVWVRGDGKLVVAGTIAANARFVEFEPVRMTATIATDRERWPADVSLQLDRDGPHWIVAGASPEFSVQFTGVAAGKHELRVSAAHHAARTVESSRDFGRVALQRLPVIAGRVVARDGGQAVVGAQITAADLPMTMTSSSGYFELEVAGPWPEHVRIAQDGYGTRLVALPRVAADVFLGPIVLAPGATLDLALRLPAEARDVTVELSEGERLVATQSVTAADPHVAFSALSPGMYHVLVRGPEPLQRNGVNVKVDEDVSLALDVEEVDLQINVTQRGASVAATIDVTNRDGRWQEVVSTGAEGHLRARAWQGGTFAVIVAREQQPGAYFERVVERDTIWDIRLPEQRVTGIVTEVKSGKSIANAIVFLKTDTANTNTLRHATTTDDGTFAFDGVEPGAQTLSVDAAGFIASATSFALQPNDPDRALTVTLARATKKTLRVVLANGAPAAGAAVLTERDRPAIPLRTDGTGRADVTIGEWETQVVYVLPREGSFAVARVSGDGEAVVSVPPGEATIILRAQDEAMQGIARMEIDIRFNGQRIPTSVLRDMAEVLGREFRTGADGRLVLEHMPLGLYDFDPFGSAGAGAPARIAVQPGTNSVILTFARRSEAR